MFFVFSILIIKTGRLHKLLGAGVEAIAKRDGEEGKEKTKEGGRERSEVAHKSSIIAIQTGRSQFLSYKLC